MMLRDDYKYEINVQHSLLAQFPAEQWSEELFFFSILFTTHANLNMAEVVPVRRPAVDEE